MVDIPFVNREEMIDRAFRIKPVRVCKGFSGLQYIFPIDVMRKPISDLSEEDMVETARNLTETTRIKTLHCAGPHNYFRPRICEVLSQIPEKHLKDTTAFHVLETYDFMTDDGNYFIATTVLYKGDLPDRIKHQRVNYIGESIIFAKYDFDKQEELKKDEKNKLWREGIHQHNLTKLKMRIVRSPRRKPF